MEVVEIIGFRANSNQKIPLFTMSVSAGSPAPLVDNDIDKIIDLNEFLIEHPVSTFFARIRGNSLKEMGIHDSDILIVDTSLTPDDGKLVLVSINNELTVKIYRKINDSEYLQSYNTQFLPISIEPFMKFNIIGVITRAIHSF
jgi:DNA polymerase V